MSRELTTQKDISLSARLDKAFSVLGEYNLNGALPKHLFDCTPQIPENQCKEIVSIVEAVMEPSGNVPELNDTALALVGAFPDHGKHDTNIYLSHLIFLLSEYNQAVHEKAIFNLVRSKKFLPSISEVEEELQNVRGKWKLAKLSAEKNLRRLEAKKQTKEKFTDEERTANKEKFDNLIAGVFGTKTERE